MRGDGTELTGISLNTALVEPGDLYAALPGSRSHGADHAAAALDAGAVAVLTDADGAGRLEELDVPTLVVEEPRALLADLCAWFYGRPSERIHDGRGHRHAGQDHHHVPRRGSTRGATLGRGRHHRHPHRRRAGRVVAHHAGGPVLQALFAVMREEAVEVCVMEVSSHAMVQERVDGFVFDVAVFLNLGRDHLDFHRDLDEYFLAKAALFTPEHAQKAVINIDDAHGRRLLDLTPLPVTTFSSEGHPADWRAANIRPHRLGTDLQVLGPAGEEVELSVPLPGVFNVSNALAVMAALTTAGLD